jgi:hypothetical protein
MRGAVAGLLALIGLLLVPLADVGVWTRHELLDRDQFTDLASQVFEEGSVRDSLADRLTEVIDRRAGVPAEGSAAVRSVVVTALGTPQFEEVLRASVGGMRDQVQRGDDQLTLDLDAVLPVVRSTAALANPSVATRIPDSLPAITVVTREEVPAFWTAVGVVRRASGVFPIACLLALAAAVVVAERRAVTLVAIGAGTALLALLLVLVIKLGREPLSHVVGTQVAKDAFDAGYGVIGDTFVTQTLLLGCGGVVAAGAGVTLLVGEQRNERPRRWA